VSKVFEDQKVIDALLDFYADDLKASMRSSFTGAEFDAPINRGALTQWLVLGIYKPEIGLVWGGDLAYSQLDVYRPYLRRTKRRYAIFTKGLKGKPASAVKVDFPVFTVSSDFAPALSIASSPSLNTLLYVTDKLENFNYIRRNPQCTHAFIGHGESDKHSSSSRLAQAYDFIFAASASSIERFQAAGIDIAANRFLITGGSPIEGIEPQEAVGPYRRVLYAPTWEGHGSDRNYSSAAQLEGLLKEFVGGGGELRFRPHPGMGSKLEAMKVVRNQIQGLTGLEDQKKDIDFNWSDVIVADVSGVVSEYLFTKKPIIIPVGKEGYWLRDFIERSALTKYCYLWPYEEKSLADMMLEIASDPMKEMRLHHREQVYVGAQNLDELCSVFEQAVNLCTATQKQYLLRNLKVRERIKVAKSLFDQLPADNELLSVVKLVKKGKLILIAKD
jgi:hypothetical protein